MKVVFLSFYQSKMLYRSFVFVDCDGDVFNVFLSECEIVFLFRLGLDLEVIASQAEDIFGSRLVAISTVLCSHLCSRKSSFFYLPHSYSI